MSDAVESLPALVDDRAPLETAAELVGVIDDVPSVIALYDLDLRVRFANWAHVAWFGKQPHELVGCSPADIVGADVFAEARPYYEAVLAGRAQTFERVMTLPGGARRHTVVTYEPYIVDGEQRGVVTMATDVSGRVRTEFARRELETRAAAMGDRERHALGRQRTATQRLDLMAIELAAVAERYPEHAAPVRDAAAAMGNAARRLSALAANGPEAGRLAGPEAVIRERLAAAADGLGFAPTLLVMGNLERLDAANVSLAARALDISLDTVARHGGSSRVDVTVSVEGAHLVLVVADDAAAPLEGTPTSHGLDRLRTLAATRGGTCSWHINADDGATIEWRVPLVRCEGADIRQSDGDVVNPRPGSARPPCGYRTTNSVGLDHAEIRVLLEHVPLGLAVWTPELCNQYSNRSACEWFGLPEPAELLGRNYADCVDTAAFERALPLARAALGGAHVVVERPFVAAGAPPRHIRAEFLPRVVAGRVVGVNVLVTDISERVRVESALRAEDRRVQALRERYAAEEEVHHLAIQEVFAAALQLDALRPARAEALADLDNALAPLDGAIADLRESVVDVRIPA